MASAQGLHIRFKKLVLQGFKSFPERTVLEFGTRLCAIVGPNGCGKSNILDALRWVLGEQSAFQLRGRRMQDIIFNGSAGRRPLGMAEVTLVLSQPSGSLPIDYDEIEITRRLYRSGVSEYRLNRTPCRLKDITELFLDSGVGKGAYALIEQGRVDALLTAHPMERRGLLEQVAGIRKYKERKKEALSKLASTSQNLDRVRDVMGEVKSRRISLARQASHAKRYRCLRDEAMELSRLVLAARYACRKHTLAELDSELDRLDNRIIRLDTETSLSSAAVQKAASRVDVVRDELHAVRRKTEQVELEIDYLEKRMADLADRERQLKTEQEVVNAETVDLSNRRRAIRERKAEILEKCAADTEQLEKLEDTRRKLDADISGLERVIRQNKKQLEGLKKAYFQAMARASEIRNRRIKLEEAVRRVTSRLDALEREYRNMTFEETGLKAESDDVAARLSELEAREHHLKKEWASAEALCRHRRSVVDEISGGLREVDTGLLETGSRLSSLREVVAAGEGLGDGVKAVLKEYVRRQGDQGIVGVLADLYETEPEYEKALSAALEARIQDVVVKDPAPVPDALEFLSRERRGRCTFTPVSPKSVNGHAPPKHLPSHAKPLLNLVRTDPAYTPLFNQLLQRTYLVDSLEEAFAAWRAEPTPVTLVTAAGEMVGPDGAITGGIEKGGRSLYRARKQEIALLETSMKQMQKRRRYLSKRRDEAESALNEAEKLRKKLEKETAEVHLETAEVRRDMEHTTRRLKHARLRREAVETERMLMETELKELKEANRALVSEAENVPAAEPVAQEIQLLEKRLESDRNRRDKLKNRHSELMVRIETVRGNIASVQREKQRMEEEDQNVLALILRLKKRSAEITSFLEQLQEEQENLSSQMQTHLDKRPLQKTKIQTLEQRLQREEEAKSSLEADLKRLEAEGHRLEREKVVIKTKKTEAESVMNTLREQFKGDLEQAAETFEKLPDETEILAWKTRLDSLEEKLAGYTDVNLAAEEEHRKLVERSRFLEEQVSDLEVSLASIRTTIKHINKTIRNRFMDAFENVNRFFGEIFRDLFEGGEASLKLTDPEDPLESGVLITCRPPGKRARSIDLMSGGEKALAALALILAGFKYRPSPIIFLDEVDAPLDDINVARFTRYLKKLAVDTQVMMVTHNAVTMEAADVLYGVTMAEAGVSRIISAELAVV